MDEAFHELLQSLADHLDVPLPEGLGSPAEFTVDDMVLNLAYDDRSTGDDLIVSATLGVVPEASELEVYRVLLEANVFWSGTGDGTLGVNSATREVYLAYRMPIESLDGESLTKVCAHFLEYATGWRDFLSAVADESTAVPPEVSTNMVRA